MWATEDASRKIVALGGGDLDALRASAESRDFHARPLAATLTLSFSTTMRSITSANVLGVLPGRDTELAREAVVVTAHHDHLGIGAAKNGDRIYNGAIDNASGVGGMLAIARAASLSPRPRRSLLFLAVAAEEQGLLGSEYYCEHPTFAPGRIAADINIDGINVDGRTTDVGFIGLGKSSLDEVVRAAATKQGRSVHGDAFPDRGGFYRSDQFSFAKIGVPAIYLKGGPDYVGRPAGWGEARVVDFETHRYHQPSDEYDPKWDWTGAVQDLELLLDAAFTIANADALPAWHPGDEFAKVPRPR
jgi:Zn-dependent M28 family amino/carboxypeptidase